MKLKHIIAGLLVSFSFAVSARGDLVGQWTFEPGAEQVDSMGNFPDLGLKGNASIANGQLPALPTAN